MPKSHPTSGSPEDWLSNDILKTVNCTGASFDFFIDWACKPPAITPVFWVKKILTPEITYEQFLEKLPDNIFNSVSPSYINSIIDFSSQVGFILELIIFRDDFDWTNNDSTLLLVRMYKNSEGKEEFSPSILKLTEFKERIRSHSGGPVQVGAKGLIYGTSRLECTLSKTDSAYPGDVDQIILDAENKPIAILEFKKHTLSPSITDQTLKKYYPTPDARKYDRIAILAEQLSKSFNRSIPIFILFYPTPPTGTQFKIEKITGTPTKLVSANSVMIPLPLSTSEENMVKCGTKIIEEIKKAL